MPPYYQILITLEEFSPKRYLSLLSVYEALLTNNFNFGGNYPSENVSCCELRDIISWNQKLIDKNFKLGWTQDSQEGYQQFLLLHPSYNHCRVITSSEDLSVIVPEYEVTLPGIEWCEDEKSLNIELIQPLKQLALTVWSTGLVTSIQTAPENGHYTPYRSLIQGQLPSIFPFSIIDKICFQSIQQLNPCCQFTKQELCTGVVLEKAIL